MVATQLDLFTGMAIATPANSETDNHLGTSAAHILNPCDGCDLREWCGEDDCAKKGYPIDLPTTRFKNLNEMITYFRTHNVLGL